MRNASFKSAGVMDSCGPVLLIHRPFTGPERRHRMPSLFLLFSIINFAAD